MNYTIKKNRHSTFRLPKLLLNVDPLEYLVTFEDTCRYDIGEDQDDINKLFGIGYFPFHRWNSVRFGWRYSKEKNKIEILGYWYTNKVRSSEHICYVDLNRKYQYRIQFYNQGRVHFSVFDLWSVSSVFEMIKIDFEHRNFGYLLRPYFGGNKKAPHNMTIKMDRI